jgi:hypothetical protein
MQALNSSSCRIRSHLPQLWQIFDGWKSRSLGLTAAPPIPVCGTTWNGLWNRLRAKYRIVFTPSGAAYPVLSSFAVVDSDYVPPAKRCKQLQIWRFATRIRRQKPKPSVLVTLIRHGIRGLVAIGSTFRGDIISYQWFLSIVVVVALLQPGSYSVFCNWM